MQHRCFFYVKKGVNIIDPNNLELCFSYKKLSKKNNLHNLSKNNEEVIIDIDEQISVAVSGTKEARIIKERKNINMYNHSQ